MSVEEEEVPPLPGGVREASQREQRVPAAEICSRSWWPGAKADKDGRQKTRLDCKAEA